MLRGRFTTWKNGWLVGVVVSFEAVHDGVLPGAEGGFELGEDDFFFAGDVVFFHGVVDEIVEFVGGFILFLVGDGVDFVGPIEEGGVTGVGLVGGEFSFWEFVGVFEESLGVGVGFARLLGFHEGFDDAVAMGTLSCFVAVPEGERFPPGGDFAIDQRKEVDAIEEGLIFDGGAGQGEEGGVDVGGDGRGGDGFGLKAGGEFDEARDAETALIDGAFFGATAGVFLDEAAVI